ncbi:MAG: histidine phosphatase family protein [Alphaproteobacteria bacterium]|nr:histidine phosphatase family protein [Alphaproteobacteria bacterium]
MKQLFLLRHAKSDWGDPGLDDFDRPLAPRGIRATKRLARHITKQKYSFDLVLCSAARRAKETWDRIASEIGSDTPVTYDRELYLAGEGSFMTQLRGLDDDARSVVLVAHNPDIAAFADKLCHDGQPDALRLLSAKYPTGGLAAIRLDCDHWADLRGGRGYLESFVVPRALPDG